MSSTRVQEWARFAESLLGAAVQHRDGQLVVRLDHHASRVRIAPGAEERVDAVGWEVADHHALAAAAAAIESLGSDVERLTGKEALAQRDVTEVVRTTDPAGNVVELFYGPRVHPVPIRSSYGSGFVTGDQGMGHVFYVVPHYRQCLEFYAALGFRPSDVFADGAVTFLHCNPREHSLALADSGSDLGLDTGFNHFMIEADDLDTVGRAYDRALAGMAPISYTLGRHSNDLMLSFYAQSPSGFDVELGFGGRRIEPATWRVRHLIDEDIWGHAAPGRR